ncbi:MAG: hypothetical protein ACOC0P_07800 [Planctomycetota bacterium]
MLRPGPAHKSCQRTYETRPINRYDDDVPSHPDRMEMMMMSLLSTESRSTGCLLRNRLPRWLRILPAVAICSLAFSNMTGCDPAASGNDESSATDVEEVPEWVDEPGVEMTPDQRRALDLDERLGFAVIVNRIKDLKLSDSEPPRVLYGTEIFAGELPFVKSRKLRVDSIAEPEGTKVLQVDVGLESPLRLKEYRSQDRDNFIPGPVITDTIGQRYYPIGYIIRDLDGPNRIEVMIDPSKQIRDLKELPTLSRARPQELRLIFRVNRGVTLNSFSYGGRDRLDFEMEVGHR